MMNDIELMALAILVEQEGREMEWANEERRSQGLGLAYGSGTLWPNKGRLEVELRNRQVAE